MEVRIVEHEAVVQRRDGDGFAAAISVSVIVERAVAGVVPEHLVRRGRTGVICNEVRSVEYPGVGTAFGKAVAERQGVEIEHVALAIVSAEVGDVIEAIGGRVVDEMIAAATPRELVVAAGAKEPVRAGAAPDIIVARTAVDVLDADERVGADLNTARPAGRQIDQDTLRGFRIVGGIAAGAAVQDIVAAAADEPVVAVGADQLVRASVAKDRVIARS